MHGNTHTPTPRILSAGAVRVSRERAPVASASNCEGQPRVHTREQGGVVREIIVTCPCGKSVVVECDYGGSGAAPIR
jgi:hypothetical protein